MAEQRAPGRLEVLREFVNTYDVEKDRDELVSADEATAWFAANDIAVDRADVTPETLESIRDLREAFRSLLHAIGHGQDDPEARDAINEAAARAALQPVLGPDGSFRLRPHAPGVDGALGELIAIALDAMAEGTWQRLKVCDNDGCAWAFYDHSRNRSGRWCSMAVCGNRMKVKAYRERSAGQ